MEVAPAPNEQFKSSEDATKGILEFLNEGEKKIITSALKNITLVLGFTGSGKSTFTQFITGNDDTLVAKETGPDTGEFIISDTGNKMCTSTIDSCTIVPELVIDKGRNSAFYDCPGFSDTRSVAHDISVTYFIKKVLDSADAVKLIFTVNYPSVREGVDRQNFMFLVKNILAMVKDVEKFSDSVALIVTKVDNQFVFKKGVPTLVPDEKIIENIVNFLKGVRETVASRLSETIAPEENDFFEKVIRLVDIFVKKTGDHYSRIGIFRRPSEAGVIRNSTLLRANKERIVDIIYKNLNFTLKRNDDFGYTVSAESLNIMHDLVDKVEEKIGAEVATIGKKIKTHFLEQEFLLTSLEEERSLYGTGVETLLTLETTEDLTEPEDLAYKIDLFVVGGLNVGVDREVQSIVRYGHFLKFLRTINSQTTSHPMEWLNGLGECSEYMKDSKMWYEFLTDLRTILSKYDAVRELQKNSAAVKELQGHIAKHVDLLRSEETELELATSMDNVMISLEQCLKQVIPDDAENKLKGIKERMKDARSASLKFSFLNDLLDFDVEISCPSQDKVVIKGRFVKVSDLIKKQSCGVYWKFVEILGYEKVFFDETVNAKGREAQVSIIAPIWEVVGRSEINLDGSPGLDVYPSKASNQLRAGGRGDHGSPGGVGGRGGCFLGVGDFCVNCMNLFISANGGRGGRGQDGGDGANGLDYHSSYNGDSNGRLYLLVYNKDTDDKVYSGQEGGNGGDGGKGGFGGLPGEIFTVMLKGGEGPVKSASSGPRGSDGNGGSPGIGGQSRRVTNKWKSVLFFPWESREERNLGRAVSGSRGRAGINSHRIEYPQTPMKLKNPHGTVKEYKENLQQFSVKSLSTSRSREFLANLEISQVLQNLKRFRRRRSTETARAPSSPSNVGFLRDAVSSIANSFRWLPYLASHVTSYDVSANVQHHRILPTSKSHEGFTVSGRVDYGLVDVPGNLLLLDLLIRTNSGFKGKPQTLDVDSVEDDFAHRMAYRAYAPSD